MSIAFLLVTCCLEQSRSEVLAEVLKNLGEQAPELYETLTVFDNASTVPGTIDVLRSSYVNVYQANKNVGYWSAIDWWLDHLTLNPPTYTYIIESDMVHYAFPKVYEAASFLDRHPELGSVRLHEYSVENWRLYNKDAPVAGSRTNLWQSHINKVTGQRVEHHHVEGTFWRTNFLTQLPALNRYETLKWCFDQLRAGGEFGEPNFQNHYHSKYPEVGILDGGIFNCDLNPRSTKTITGSWTDPNVLRSIGYQPTRIASITPRDQYNVQKV